MEVTGKLKQIDETKKFGSKEFKKREKKWLNKGGKFLLPFPKLKIIN